MDYADTKKRLNAAYGLLSESTTTLEKVRSLKALISGINPELDKKWAELDRYVSTIEHMESGEVIDLAIDSLPEVTEEQKKRKKVLVLFFKYWNDLKSEVQRVQNEFESQKQSGQGGSVWARIFSASKGPLAIVTIIAVGIAALSATSVDITIQNNGCSTLYANSKVPISLPGLVLPSDPIPSGGSATATIPPLAITIDGTSAGTLTISSLKLNFSIQLSKSIRDVTFDGVSLLGKKTDIQLSERDAHALVLTCQ